MLDAGWWFFRAVDTLSQHQDCLKAFVAKNVFYIVFSSTRKE